MSVRLRFGVMGWPLGHTISPAFQQAALEALRLNATYVAAPTTDSQVEDRIQEVRDGSWQGLNVTIPHKLRVAQLMDSLEPAAERLGAVNTVAVSETGLVGDNTDGVGFARALTEHGGFNPVGTRTVLVGAGGAGHAVAWALHDLGVQHLVIANRRPHRSESLAALLPSQSLEITLRGLDEAALARELREADLLVNATSLGMHGGPGPDKLPVPAEWLHDQLFVCDIVYRPAETPLMAQARSIGCRVMGGLEMLVLQGAASLKRWTGHTPPLPIMMSAARSALSAPLA
jgi:shikimate dehydrogenase